jgi:hypothetical protein
MLVLRKRRMLETEETIEVQYINLLDKIRGNEVLNNPEQE